MSLLVLFLGNSAQDSTAFPMRVAVHCLQLDRRDAKSRMDRSWLPNYDNHLFDNQVQFERATELTLAIVSKRLGLERKYRDSVE